MKKYLFIILPVLFCLFNLFPEDELIINNKNRKAMSIPNNQYPSKSYNVELVKSEMEPLDFTTIPSYSSQTLSYFDYYNLNFEAVHYFGTFESQDFTIAAHIFDPGEARGTVFLLHGYYDHTGILSNIIKLCIEKKLAVAVFDFPGHGLSSGTVASIDSFSQYVSAFKDFFELCKPYITKPYYMIGHSMGGAVIFEYLFQNKNNPFEKSILLSPAVRSSYYILSRIGYFIMSPFWDYAPRWFRNSSSNKQFLEFYRTDPIQYRRFPMKWADSFYTWNRRIKNYSKISSDVTVIQGTKDNVVDWRYNIPFLKKKIPNLKTIYIKNARHQLMNEGEPFLGKFNKALKKQLSSL